MNRDIITRCCVLFVCRRERQGGGHRQGQAGAGREEEVWWWLAEERIQPVRQRHDLSPPQSPWRAWHRVSSHQWTRLTRCIWDERNREKKNDQCRRKGLNFFTGSDSNRTPCSLLVKILKNNFVTPLQNFQSRRIVLSEIRSVLVERFQTWCQPPVSFNFRRSRH